MNLRCLVRKAKDYMRYDVPRGISNLRRWFTVIWTDRNYDFYFIFVILRHKLYLTQKHIRNHDIHVHAERDADRMKLCVLLLDRLIKDDYHEMAFKNHDKKWGDIELKTKPTKENPDLYSVDFHRDNIKTPEDREQERKEFNNAYEHEQYLIQQDLDLLFNTMRKHIREWWD